MVMNTFGGWSGAHFPEASLPGMYSARGAGGHYLLVVPTLDLIIVHRVDNDPPAKDSRTVLEAGWRGPARSHQGSDRARISPNASIIR